MWNLAKQGDPIIAVARDEHVLLFSSLRPTEVSGYVMFELAVGDAADDFTDDAIADPTVLAVARKVRYETPEYPTYPQAFPGGVRVKLTSGETLESDFPHQRGGPENPLSAAEVRAKFRDNAGLADAEFCLTSNAGLLPDFALRLIA